ncbi:hypothetical protein FA13DRAFT_709015 [Coprinellus micaceus]|uniref:Uncharacterized protein n=1 Tax=Coprinellus micaceus TaxID=71717 RepID=A0A4Y7TW58_COPMI|nr:hypothetical protein FA13DRAFT_709015 [Coprinellus micaceus]
MSTEAALLNLSTTISGLQSQIEELKQGKRDLRSDKECLKNELLGLKEELGNALAEASRLRNELQGTNVALEYWKSPSELERSAQEAQDQVSHQSTAVQIMPDTTSQIVRESGSAIVDDIPPAAQDIPFTASTTVAASPDEPLLPEPVANNSLRTSSSRSKKRKTVAVDEGDRTRFRKHSPRRAGSDARWQRRTQAPAGMAIPMPIGTQPLSRGRPVVPFKEDEAFILPPHILQRYPEHAPPLDISSPPSDVHVSRELLGDLHGGSPRQDAQHITPIVNPSGNSTVRSHFPGSILTQECLSFLAMAV